MTATVRLGVAGGIATLVLGTGRRRNALDDQGWRELAALAHTLAADETVRVVLIQGHGDDFCAGSDLSTWRDAETATVVETFARMELALRAVERIPVPVLAVVNGVAAGAGCQLALACDLRVVSLDARIGMPTARLGILLSPSFALRLVSVAGAGLARDLLYTGRLISGAEAFRHGIADRAVPPTGLQAEAARIAVQIAALPRVALVASKSSLTTALAAVTDPARRSGGTLVDEPAFRAALTRGWSAAAGRDAPRRTGTAGTGTGR